MAQLGSNPDGEGGAGGASGGGGRRAERAAPSATKEVGPLPELSASNWDEACGATRTLCAIALLDGGPDNTNREAQLDIMRKLHKRNAGGPLLWSWVDATCHVGFGTAFDLSETDLPALVVVSPSKLRWARAIGAFEASTLGAFAMGVAKGSRGTDALSALPTLDEVDCATVPRGAAAAASEDDPLGDEIMAEILEEERREREAREAELAAASVESSGSAAPAKSASEMSPLEKLEAEIEECTSQDLLCVARNEKVHKKIQQRRELEERLAKIAKKKKKAKKKKAKA